MSHISPVEDTFNQIVTLVIVCAVGYFLVLLAAGWWGRQYGPSYEAKRRDAAAKVAASLEARRAAMPVMTDRERRENRAEREGLFALLQTWDHHRLDRYGETSEIESRMRQLDMKLDADERVLRLRAGLPPLPPRRPTAAEQVRGLVEAAHRQTMEERLRKLERALVERDLDAMFLEGGIPGTEATIARLKAELGRD